jgi:hypothetical protein
MVYDNLRELLLAEKFVTPTVGVEVPNQGPLKLAVHDSPVYDKDENVIAYIFDADGFGITALEKPRRIVVPMVLYKTEAEIQEKISALLWLSATGSYAGGDTSFVKAWASKFSALLARPDTAKKLDEAGMPCPVYESAHEFKSQSCVLGLAKPEFVGRVVSGSDGKVGLVVCGGVMAVELNSALPYNLST